MRRNENGTITNSSIYKNCTLENIASTQMLAINYYKNINTL